MVTAVTPIMDLGAALLARPLYSALHGTMKSIGVTELQQHTAEILDVIRDSEEPVAILQRSQKRAYLVDAGHYDAERDELRAARRALFLREVREAEAEYASGGSTAFADMDELLDTLRG